MSFRRNTLATVQGILLLLAWPLPTGGLTSCVTFPFAAAILNLGTRLGLHMASEAKDFSREVVPPPSD